MQQDLIILAVEFGLRREEVEHLQKDELVTYFNYFHGRDTKTSSLLLYGFSERERKEIAVFAKSSNFLLEKKPNEFVFSDINRVAFVCSMDSSIIEEAKYFGTTILSREFFEKFHSAVFSQKTTEANFDFLLNKQVPNDYRIAVPLSNYSRPYAVHSFSQSYLADVDDDNPQNQIIYSVNIHRMTCTCKDFLETNRAQFDVGDIRRLCKHLISKYNQVIGTNGLSNFSRSVLQEGYGLKKNIQNVQIDGVALPIAINYKDADSMWNIFFPNAEGTYKRYGYFPEDETFYYNEKPIGYVKPLRLKLKEFRNKLKGIDSGTSVNKRKVVSSASSKTKNKYSQPTEAEYPPLSLFIFGFLLMIWLFSC